MSRFALRAVAEEDRAALLAVWVEAWRGVLPQIDFDARRDWFDTHLRGLEAGGAVTLVATLDRGRPRPPFTHLAEEAGGDARGPIGFVNFHPNTGYIDQIAVALAWQGAGAAQALLAAAKATCPNGLSLKVNQQNPRAIRCYEREEFAIVAEGVSEASGLPLWHMAWVPKS